MDKAELVKKQYLTSDNLDARQQLHSYNINKHDWNEWCFENMRIPEGARVLELGCGNGMLWEKNSGKISDSWEIILSDMSEGMLKTSRERLLDIHGRFSYKTVDVQSIPYDDESMDVVIARHMLYHVPDLDRALSEIKRVLKPGGVFYATTNGEGAMGELKQLVDKFDTSIGYTPDRLTEEFGIVSGEKLIKRYFKQVSLKRFDGRIVVTIPEPVVNYIKSTSPGSRYFEAFDKEGEFLEYVDREIQSKGSISITTAAGIFEAVKE